MRNSNRWSCPGSLLIAGEYRITEEGGKGIAVAAGPLAHAVAEPSSTAVAAGIWTGGRFEWTISNSSDETRTSSTQPSTKSPGSPGSQENAPGPDPSAPAGTVFANLAEAAYRFSQASLRPFFSVSVDTTEFFRKDGVKLGFGSSAAACVLFCHCFSGNPTAHNGIGTAEAAIRAHRAWQGGKGSGYDVLASIFGGAGYFRGGKNPAWTPLVWHSSLEAWIIHAHDAVKTPGAVEKYRRWRRSEPSSSGRILMRSDDLAKELAAMLKNGSDSPPEEMIKSIRELSNIGRDIGEFIGVPAVPHLPIGLAGLLRDRGRKDAAVKCLGAGDETMLLITKPGGLTADERSSLKEAIHSGIASPLEIRRNGLREELS